MNAMCAFLKSGFQESAFMKEKDNIYAFLYLPSILTSLLINLG